MSTKVPVHFYALTEKWRTRDRILKSGVLCFRQCDVFRYHYWHWSLECAELAHHGGSSNSAANHRGHLDTAKPWTSKTPVYYHARIPNLWQKWGGGGGGYTYKNKGYPTAKKIPWYLLGKIFLPHYQMLKRFDAEVIVSVITLFCKLHIKYINSNKINFKNLT